MRVVAVFLLMPLLRAARLHHRSCLEWLESSDRLQYTSGKYEIHPYKFLPHIAVTVWCDMSTEGGGWTVIQRRDLFARQENFYRSYREYRLGFGYPSRDHWLGLEHIHALTSLGHSEIYFKLVDFNDKKRYAKYEYFYVHDKDRSYMLEVSGYSGNAGDAFTYHNGRRFSTKDHDKDAKKGSCAKKFRGAWWYGNCFQSNLNGRYQRAKIKKKGTGVHWSKFRGNAYSLKSVVMMIK